MARLFVIVSCLVAAGAALPVKLVEEYPSAPAHYEFSYSVHDAASGDIKQQQESRQGDVVHGSYSLVEADGTHRIVDYTADAEHGFNAVVRHEGEPRPQPQHAVAKLAYAAPVAKIAYAAPVTKLAYAAPVTKLAYAAPVTKLAYAASVAKIAYAQPAPVYAAPVAKLAYAAPVAKVAYAAPATHVSYASPIISYHH